MGHSQAVLMADLDNAPEILWALVSIDLHRLQWRNALGFVNALFEAVRASVSYCECACVCRAKASCCRATFFYSLKLLSSQDFQRSLFMPPWLPQKCDGRIKMRDHCLNSSPILGNQQRKSKHLERKLFTGWKVKGTACETLNMRFVPCSCRL